MYHTISNYDVTNPLSQLFTSRLNDRKGAGADNSVAGAPSKYGSVERAGRMETATAREREQLLDEKRDEG